MHVGLSNNAQRRLRATHAHVAAGQREAHPVGCGGAPPRGPLDGILVLDLGQAITGPLAATMLGDMGATVIKVESPSGMGDLNRPIGPARNGEGIYMHNFNRGKKGIVLNLKKPSAQVLAACAHACVRACVRAWAAHRPCYHRPW
jgi:hypothetical protein